MTLNSQRNESLTYKLFLKMQGRMRRDWRERKEKEKGRRMRKKGVTKTRQESWGRDGEGAGGEVQEKMETEGKGEDRRGEQKERGEATKGEGFAGFVAFSF